MKGVAITLAVLCLLLIGSTSALKKRSATGDEPQAPVLEHLEIPDVDITNTTGAVVRYAASDPAGVKYIHITYGDNSGIVGEASWNGTSSSQTSVSGEVAVRLYRTSAGIYPASVTVCDILNNCDTYDEMDLDSAGFQSTAILFSNVVSVQCPTEEISVMDDVEFDCTLTITSNPLPVVSYNIFASLYNGAGVVLTTVYPDGGSFDDPDAQSSSLTVPVTFRLAKYAPNGTYVVTAEASQANYLYDDASTTFKIKAEINDLSAPTLTNVNAPSITLPASSSTPLVVNIAATDDAVGLKSITLEIPGFGTGSWESSSSAVGTDVSVQAAISITPIYGNLVRRLYFIKFTMCDKTDKCVDWAAPTLQQAGFQSTFNVGPVDPNASAGTLACGGPYDVANGPVIVSCKYDVTYVTGIYTYTVFVTRDSDEVTDEPVWTMQATPGYYEDTTGNNITQSSTQTFTLPQYAPYGNYTVLATAYDDTLTNSLATTTKILVSQTTNDMGPPELRALSVPIPPKMDITQFKARVSAADDASGVGSIQVYLYSKGTTGVGMVNITSANPRVVSNVDVPITMNIYNSSDSIFFVVEVMLIDVLGNKRYYSTLDLGKEGFQANVTVLPTPVSTTGNPSSDTGSSVAPALPATALALVLLALLNFYLL